MGKKIAKGLWIPSELAKEFDQEVRRLGQVMCERLEAGQMGSAALLAFLRLPDDKQKLEAIRAARIYSLDKIIEALPAEKESHWTVSPRPVPRHRMESA